MTNGLVQVNSGAVFLSMPAKAIGATNSMVMNINGTGNRFVVNGGQVIATNRVSNGANITGNVLFQFNNGTSNQFIITNGGVVTTYTPSAASGLANQGNNNGLYVGGTNATGGKSMWISSASATGERFNFNAGGTNWLAVDAGGVVTNVNFFGYGTTWVYVTNGGAFYHNGLIIGRNGNNCQLLVAGADGAGNKATVAGNTGQGLTVGGGTATPTGPSPGSNSWARIDAGGVLTNSWICVGQDTNSWNNALFITNGGQVFTGTGSGNISAGGTVQGLSIAYAAYCFSNSATLGGGANTSLLNLGSGNLTVGNGGVGVSNNTVTVLSGGIVTNVNSVILGGINTTLNLNGGTVAAGTNGNLIATNSTSVNATSFVQAGGATINDNGFKVTNQLALVQDPNSTGGGLTKLGGGTLTLLGVNTYTGPTVVNAGTLALSGSASIASSPSITLAGGGAFDVSGLTGGFTLGGGQTLSNSASTATINCGANGFSAVSGTVALTYAAGTPSLAATSGTLTLSGSTVFNVNNTGAALAAGSYCLITNLAGGVVAGSVPAVTVGGGGIAGDSVALAISNSALYLVVHSSAPVIVPTTLGLASSGNPSVNYAPVIFTATVLTNGTPATAATGNVVFLVDAVTVFTNGVNAGVAQYTNNLLTVAGSPHAVVAEYLGDANYGASTSSSLSQVVNPPALATNLTFNLTGGGTTLSFSWPTNYLGWGLQSNAVDLTVGVDWHLVPGSTTTNSVSIPVDPGQTNVFYRMIKP